VAIRNLLLKMQRELESGRHTGVYKLELGGRSFFSADFLSQRRGGGGRAVADETIRGKGGRLSRGWGPRPDASGPLGGSAAPSTSSPAVGLPSDGPRGPLPGHGGGGRASRILVGIISPQATCYRSEPSDIELRTTDACVQPLGVSVGRPE